MTFDLVAPVYDALAWLVFGRSLIRAQQWGIEQVKSGDRVMILGGGTGVTLPDIAARKPASILFIEASMAMLATAKRRALPDSVPITFLHGTEANVPDYELFDSVVLPFVLDLYPAATLQSQLLPALLRYLRPGGQLIVTDFDQPRTYRQRTYMWLMIRFFRLTASIAVRTWTNWPALLQQGGLSERVGRSFRGGQVRSGCWMNE